MPITPQPILEDLNVVGIIDGLNEVVILALSAVSGGKAVVSGTWSGTIKFEGTLDGTRWDTIESLSGTTGTLVSQTGITSNDIIVFVGIAGLAQIRARFHAYTSGSATVTLRGSTGAGNVFVNSLIPSNLKTQSYVNDGSGNAITSTTISATRSLDTNVIQGPPPHMIGYTPVHKAAEYSVAQTDTIIWTPASGKKFVVTDYMIIASGNQDTTMTLFDNTNSAANWLFRGTLDLAVNNPVITPTGLRTPFVSAAINQSLKITFTTNAVVSVMIFGYEI